MANKLTKTLQSQSFTLALIAAVGASILIPELGIKGGPLKTETTTKIAVALTFVIQGLSLPTRQIAASAAKLRLHVFCQAAIFLLAPALMLGFLFVFGSWIHPGVKAGFFYLAALPTTISSAIVMTSNSEGDSSAALFSTTLSNVMGIFATPLLCSLFLASSSEAAPPLSSLVAKLSLLVLLPLVVGQLIRPFVREWAVASKKLFKRLSNAFIVFIVFAAFCQSVNSGIWGEVGTASVVTIFLFTTLFLLFFSAVVWAISPLGSKRIPERIAAFFCGSQKTLAAGVPMASILFANLPTGGSSAIGLIILPLMCYHPLQLFLAGALSPYFARIASK
ncbi:bile acid:sodium symporter family protein [Pelagicoccus sp. SDUM812002]|uniref:bile acid:sodium symporter family protein n=1 Tax=Pelagicoccus sp. SDUM812002 TaxID=3041266 RepID=UPI00280EA170|nr:bile acid:sodium symporter family protein [Pelagicoccus sp. SDUM812002]MDQ8187774.1 bile acid:sodium symporter [Pelagicoccus sp. SDUM812002]